MKSSIAFLLMFFCIILAAQQIQAKKGCNAYGHACYGGHGKRSLATALNDQEEVGSDAILQMVPNDVAVFGDGEIDAYPKYRLIKIMKNWLNGHARRPSERINEIDYPISGEGVNRDNNNNSFK